MNRLPVPTVKHYTRNLWAVARQPGVDDAWRVFYDGAHVGWIQRRDDGWRWVADGPHRQESTVPYTSWQKAADRLAHTPGALRVAGRVVTPSEWIPAQGKPWVPGTRHTTAPAGAP